MDVHLIQLAIPFFFLLILIELVLNRVFRTDYYDLNDSIADLSCGITQQITTVFYAAVYLSIYVAFYEHARLFTLPKTSWWVYLLCFMGVDLAYYWFHRSCHRINFFWGGHAAHHQSEEYNLTVALRQGTFSEPLALIFYLPLAILGFHPVLFFVCKELNIIYQFWIHTRMIGRLGAIEWVFNTPSHHRVHHGKNPKYIDKNHAGVFIFWDKLFGSFQPEEEEPIYGTVSAFSSWNPLWANVEHWFELYHSSRGFEHLSDKFKVWCMPPGWTPEQPNPHIPEVDASFEKFKTPLPFSLKVYVLLQFILVLVLSLAFLSLEPQLDLLVKAVSAGFLLVSMLTLSGIQSAKKWAFPLELARLNLILLTVLVWPLGLWVKCSSAFFVLLFLSWWIRAFQHQSRGLILE